MLRDSFSPGDVPLLRDGAAADVCVVAPAADVVDVAAADFADDVERVTGVRPSVTDGPSGSAGAVVVTGIAGESDLIDRCLAASDAETDSFDDGTASDDGTAFADCRESFVIATLAEPPDPVSADACLLVAGSDRRGTAYGLYELSKRMGVSPWYWWADVPVDEREEVVVAEGTYEFGPPDVRYRGIFLNDEDFGLRPWASQTFAPEDAEERDGIGPKTYERLFELLLRLRANTIWPAMHSDTKAFYRYPEHADLAERYAIVVGASHCEPMHRNNVDEWDESEMGEWNYATNRETIREYWRERVADVADYENQFTIGMRGIHDSGMPGAETTEERVDLLQEVVDDQREMLADVHGEPADEIPQIFCPYKEVLPLLRGGLDVPDDVCLVWPDDSHGYLRDLPTAEERERAGGSGVYYHLSYWGRPHDFLWLSSVPLALVRHQLSTAYEAGARDCWILNVGDVKPTEKEMEFGLDLAWDVDGDAAGSTREWLESWAHREFDSHLSTDADAGEPTADTDDFAAEVADVLLEYYRLCQSRKPEHMGWSTVYPDTHPDEPAFSAVHAGDEARRRVDSFEAIAERATELSEKLEAEARPSFYQLVVHPVRCAALMSEKYLAAARNRLYAGQGRAAANDHAERALDAHDRIQSETDYFNEELLDGKWNGMQSASPRDLPVFDEPSTASVDPHDGAALGVAVEGTRRPARRHEESPPALPTFDSVTDRTHFVDVFARGTEPVEWTVETSADWIDVSATSGTVSDERRLSVGVDWQAVPTDSRNAGVLGGEIVVSGAGVEKTARVRAEARSEPDGDFAETNGRVAIEAEDFSRRRDSGERRWERTDLPGRVSGATMAVRPRVFESVDDVADAPKLEYDVELRTDGEIGVEVQCVPTQSLTAEHDLRAVVSIGESVPQIVSIDVDGGEHNPEWQQNVLRGAAIGSTTHTVDEPGARTLSVWALDPGLVVDRIVLRATDASDRPTYLGPRETRVRD